MQKIILHIDFDSFFASVEQQDHPEFRNKPFGVTAHNNRNCIIAASREAKKLGIGTASRRSDALRICPDFLFISADFEKYWRVSQQFLGICKDFSPFIEVFSIDELFMDVSMTAHLFGGVFALIDKLKQRIANEIGFYITVSVGISYNKILAKLGSGLKKPDGVVEIKKSQLLAVYAIAKLQNICGIGPRIEKRLHQMGIYTLLRLHRTPLAPLIAEFGTVEGTFLYNVGQGIDTSLVKSFARIEEAKSVSRNYCLPHNEYDARKVLQAVYELYEELGIKLRRLQMKSRHVGLFFRGQENLEVHKTVDGYFDTGKDMFELCLKLLFKTFCPESPYPPLNQMYTTVIHDINHSLHYVRQISVWAGFLQKSQYTSLHMFTDTHNYTKVMRSVDKMNEKFGDHTIRNGFLLYSAKLKTVPNGFMGDRYERKKLAKVYQNMD